MSKLVLILADGGVQDILLDRERLTIGRRPDNDICLPFPAVSGEHAAVVTILADSFLEDQGSTNGTLVNGRPITKHFLRDRDQIDIGRQRLVYVVDEAATIDVPRAVLANADEKIVGERVKGAPKPVPRVHGAAVAAAASAPPPPPPARARPDTAPAASAPATASAPPPAAVPSLKVLTGPNAGRSLPLTKAQTLVGRVGLQVAAVRKTSDGLVVVPVEGAGGPTVNGAIAGRAGLPLHAGDVIEVAGTRLELVASEAAEAVAAPAQVTPEVPG